MFKEFADNLREEEKVRLIRSDSGARSSSSEAEGRNEERVLNT